MTEVTRRQRQDRETRLVAAFEDAPVAVLLLEGPDHVFVHGNPAAWQMLGSRHRLGQPVREAMADLVDLDEYVAMLDHVPASGETVRAEAGRSPSTPTSTASPRNTSSPSPTQRLEAVASDRRTVSWSPPLK